MKKRYGFTLAEVLITLGIIGVVAAMTIPTLMSNTNSAKFRSQFKKSISTLNQAGLMAQAQYDVDFAAVSACTAVTDNPNTTISICGIFNGTLTGHTITATVPTNNGANYAPTMQTANIPSGNPTYLTMADGSMLVFNSSAAACTKAIGAANSTIPAVCRGYIDVNGPTLPNREVVCATVASTAISDGTCNVPADANHMRDIYPVVFHDGTVEPLTNAARYVLTTSK